MLVVVANWGIADGTLVAAARRDQVAWLRAVRRAVIRAGFRRDGRYQPPDRVDVVLAGDTFDLLTSTAWMTQTRPWHRGARARAARAGVLAAAAASGGRLLAGLRRWARTGIVVPRVGRHGRPAPGTATSVPVGVAILAGDRDAWLEDAHPAAARHGIGLGAAWAGSACAASVRHGHEFDPFTCGDCEAAPDRDRGPTLAESLAVDLVARFAGLLAADAIAWPAARRLVAALAGTRPAQMAGVFQRWKQRGDAGPATVADRWTSAVDTWWREARHTRPTCGVEYDPIDAIATTLAAAPRAATAAAAKTSFDLPVCLPAGGGADGTSGPLVLGHPAAAAAGNGGTTLVCLGRAPPMRGPPATAVFTGHSGPIRQDWLHEESEAVIVSPRGPWSDQIVEAA